MIGVEIGFFERNYNDKIYEMEFYVEIRFGFEKV